MTHLYSTKKEKITEYPSNKMFYVVLKWSIYSTMTIVLDILYTQHSMKQGGKKLIASKLQDQKY